MIVVEGIDQGSIEWLNLRLGKVTASKMKDVLTNGKGTAPSKTAESYMMDLVCERLTGEIKPMFENDAMAWGTATEPQARAMYELRSGNDVKEIAFVEANEYLGISPDGFVGDDGLLEIKCPNTKTQLYRALSNNYSKDYKAQIQCQLWVCGREWCDFLSFDPRLDVDASYLLERVYRDEDFIQQMKNKTEIFIEKMKETIERLTK